MGLLNRLAHAFNAFTQLEEPNYRAPTYVNLGYSSTSRPDRMHFSNGNERSIVTAIYTRIANDVADMDIRHVMLDEEGRFVSIKKSHLNNCLTVEANKDQTAKAFIRDIVFSMLDEGCVAIVPTDTDIDPEEASFDIDTMRVASITQWYPDHVRLKLYDDNKGFKREILLPKKNVCILENPFYPIMNAPNSTSQRLIRKLNILDAIDEQSGSGKLDLIIQLPYIVKSEKRKAQAEERRQAIEDQLSGSKYGIAYTDGTEKITQLNRAVDNNLLNQVQYLTSMLYSQLGITEEIMNGTADEKTMLNYINRTIKPIISEIVDEMKRKFLTKTARTQNQSIKYFLDPFKLMPLTNLAELADKFTRNEIMTSNEIRQVIGLKPVNDPGANELRNKNLNIKDNQRTQEFVKDAKLNNNKDGGNNQNGQEN